MSNGNGHNASAILSNDLVLIDLDVSVWGARKALTPEDLDKKPSEIPDIYYLGHKTLVPKESLKQGRALEGRGRSVLERYGFRFPIGMTRAVPVAVLPEVEAALEEVKQEFEAWADTFETDFPALKEATIAEHGEELRPLYPDAATVRSKFRFDWVIVNVSVPEGNSENAAKVKAKIESWVDEIAVEFRQTAAEVFDTVTKKLERGEMVTEFSFNAVRRAIDRLRAINFLNDQTVEAQLAKAKEALSKFSAEGCRTDPLVRESARAALTTVVKEIKNVGDVNEITGGFKRKLRI